MTAQLAIFVAAALLLSLERLTYAWVWRRPERFRALAARLEHVPIGKPVELLHAVFWAFKGLQVAVFLGWCYWWGGGHLLAHPADSPARFLGVVLLVLGQLLNGSVFLRLGKTGVFYGARFGQHVPWCSAFPFSVLRHPQYVGAVLSIWGFFMVTRFPNADWVILPALETLYYAAGARLER
ncbi:MAG TPA: methyltransferase [Myxococcota bacterium]|nr:methyltransferase [Myxococcota bacterium]